MNNNKLMNFLYHIMEWIMRLAYINVLWIIFTVAGMVIGGFFPATVGTFTVVRQWLIKDADTVKVWQIFWEAYRKNFVKINLVGYVFLLPGIILYIDIKFFQMHDGMFYLLMTYFSTIVFIIYLAMWVFLFPVFVHYELKKFEYIKQTFFIVMLRPLNFLAIVGVLGAIYFLMLYLPVSILLFGVGIFGFVTMWIALHAFKKLQLKIDDRKNRMTNNYSI